MLEVWELTMRDMRRSVCDDRSGDTRALVCDRRRRPPGDYRSPVSRTLLMLIPPDTVTLYDIRPDNKMLWNAI